MKVYILRTDDPNDDVRIQDVYEDKEDAREAFEKILSNWWPKGMDREKKDYNGRNYQECVKDMIYCSHGDTDCIVVEEFEVVPGKNKAAELPAKVENLNERLTAVENHLKRYQMLMVGNMILR